MLRRWQLVAALLGCALVASCGAGATPGSGAGPHVAAAFYPFAYVAERVVGPAGSVTNLTPPGAEAHDVELTPQQVATVAEADLVVYLEGFQPAVDDAVEHNADGAVLEVADVVALADADRAEHGDGHAHGHGGEPDLAGDPHIWLDPTKLVPVAHQTAARLAELAPASADGYRARADRLAAELRRLDRDFRAGLASCARDVFVTSHAAFGYLARRYGLEMVAISGMAPDAEPSPAQLTEIADVVRRERVTTIFSETLVDPATAQTLAAEVGVRTAVLDPVEGLTEQSRGDDYFGVMRANLAALREANGCR